MFSEAHACAACIASEMTCVQCSEDDSIALIFVLSAIAISLIGLGLMWRYVLSNKSLVVRYVATFIILLNHAQSLAIIGNMDLRWPPVVREMCADGPDTHVPSLPCHADRVCVPVVRAAC